LKRSRFLSPILLAFLFLTSCSFPFWDGNAALPPFVVEDNNQLFIDVDQVALLVDEQGIPTSTRITEDESLGTVHTFDLLAVIVFPPTRSELDGLWRLDAWVSSGNSVNDPGNLVTIVLGYDDTAIEYDLLPGYLFEYKSGNTETIGNIIPDLKAGDQVFVHVIGEQASELIHIGQACMFFEGTLDFFIQAVFNFPTLSDLYKYAAYDGLGRLQRYREVPGSR